MEGLRREYAEKQAKKAEWVEKEGKRVAQQLTPLANAIDRKACGEAYRAYYLRNGYMPSYSWTEEACASAYVPPKKAPAGICVGEAEFSNVVRRHMDTQTYATRTRHVTYDGACSNYTFAVGAVLKNEALFKE